MALSGLSTPVFCLAMGPFRNIDIAASVSAVGPFVDVDIATLVGPFRIIDIAASVGPFRIIDARIRQWLWAHSAISTLLLRWADSGLSTPVFGGGYGPIQLYRHCCFGGPIQEFRRRYSVVAIGPFRYIDIIILQLLWAHSRISTSASVGPLKIIEVNIRYCLQAHSELSVAYFCITGRRISVGLFKYIDGIVLH